MRPLLLSIFVLYSFPCFGESCSSIFKKFDEGLYVENIYGFNKEVLAQKTDFEPRPLNSYSSFVQLKGQLASSTNGGKREVVVEKLMKDESMTNELVVRNEGEPRILVRRELPTMEAAKQEFAAMLSLYRLQQRGGLSFLKVAKPFEVIGNRVNFELIDGVPLRELIPNAGKLDPEQQALFYKFKELIDELLDSFEANPRFIVEDYARAKLDFDLSHDQFDFFLGSGQSTGSKIGPEGFISVYDRNQVASWSLTGFWGLPPIDARNILVTPKGDWYLVDPNGVIVPKTLKGVEWNGEI